MDELFPTQAVAHGGLLDDELAARGIYAEEVLDLSVSINPYGPSPAVRRAIATAALHRYPDPSASIVRRSFAEHFGVTPTRIVVGNGAVDLLWILARAHLRAGDRVAMVEPTFSEMRAAAEKVGATVVELRTRPEEDFALSLGALDDFLCVTRPALLYICNPGNPTGVCIPREAIEEIAARHPGTLFVVDVSFLSMSTLHADGNRPLRDGILWVQSLTKDHALAGVRIGFAVAPDEIARRMDAERPPWSVNAFAQAAAIATTTADAQRHLVESRDRLLGDRAYLADALHGLGLRVHPSETIYLLAGLGPRIRATDLRQRLLDEHRVLVRDATSFGLPHHVRLAARPRADIDRVVRALEEVLRR